MKRFSILATLAVAACTETGSGGFVVAGGTRVNPVNADVFEVIARPGNEVNQFWCGAGEYARRTLGAPSNAHVYVVGEAGTGYTMDTPSAAQFSLKPPSQAQGASGRTARWGPNIGENKFVADASRHCGARLDSFI